MTDAKHTPTPWRLSDDLVRRVIRGGDPSRTIIIVEAWTTDADAELIVSAVNAYDDLLAACEEGATVDGGERDEPFADTLESIGRGTGWEDYCIEKAKQIRAAIAAAKG